MRSVAYYDPSYNVLKLNKETYTFSCRGVVRLGVPDPWNNWGGPAKVGACKSLLFTESSLVVKLENTCLIFLIVLNLPLK